MTDPTGFAENRTYYGARAETSSVRIRTSTSATSYEDTTTVFDSLGRTISVSTPEYTTSFAYDPYDQQVSATRSGPAGGLTQTRSYGYDARGYLLWEMDVLRLRDRQDRNQLSEEQYDPGVPAQRSTT